MSVGDIIRSVAPAIATALGGPLAGAAVAFLADKLGVSDPTQERIQQILANSDPVQLREMELDFQKFMAANGIRLALAQVEVNKEEAKSLNWWVAGWRPAVGWVCVIALALSYIPKALALTLFWASRAYLTFAHPEVELPELPPFPDLGVTDLLGLLGGILGIGVLRTVEKCTHAEDRR